MTSIRSLAIIAAMVAATFGALALMPAERGSPEGEAAAKPVAPEPPKHVSALDLDEP